MLFWTLKNKYKSIHIVDNYAKLICKFENNRLETEDQKIIRFIKNKNRFPWIYFEDEKVIEIAEEVKEIKKSEKIDGMQSIDKRIIKPKRSVKAKKTEKK